MSESRLLAEALINPAAGAADFRNSNGAFASVTNTVAGIFVLTLVSDKAIQRQDCAVYLSVDENPNPPRQCVANLVHTSDTVKTVNVTEADAAGVGVLTDLGFSIQLRQFSAPGTL